MPTQIKHSTALALGCKMQTIIHANKVYIDQGHVKLNHAIYQQLPTHTILSVPTDPIQQYTFSTKETHIKGQKNIQN